METGEGDTWGNVDRDVNHHGGPHPVAHAHTYSNGDRYASRHFHAVQDL